MTNLSLVGVAALIGISAALGCSDDETGDAGNPASTGSGTGAAGASGGSGAGGDETPAESCVQKGAEGNNLGIGHYCTPGGGECADFPEAGLCLADVGQDQWFCVQIGCTETSDCGEDAGCELNPAGSACIPCSCDDQTAQCQAGAGGSGSGGTGGGSAGGAGGAGGTGGAG